MSSEGLNDATLNGVLHPHLSRASRYGFSNAEVREEQGTSAETITARAVKQGILEDISKGIISAIIVSSFTRLTRDMDDIDGRIIKKTCRDHDCVIITPEKLYDFSNEADDDLADLQFFFSKIQKRMNLKPIYTYRADLRILSDSVFERNQLRSRCRF